MISTPNLVMLDDSVVRVRIRATFRTVAPMSLSIEGTRVPSAALACKAAIGPDAPFYGSLVGSPAWSPPV